MKSTLIRWVFLFHTTTCLYAVNNLRIPDTRSIAMGGNGVTQSTYYNPAILPFSSQIQIGFTYYNQYQLPELNSLNGIVNYPNSLLPIGVHIASFGYDEYRESMFRLLVGKQLSERWYLGVSGQFYIIHSELYEEDPTALSIDIGVAYQPFDNLLVGLLIMNTPIINIKRESFDIKDIITHRMEIGFQYRIIEQVLIAVTTGYDKREGILGNIGIEYCPFNTFHIYTGVRNMPFTPSFGCGYRFSHFKIDIATTFHPTLGTSTGVGLVYSF